MVLCNMFLLDPLYHGLQYLKNNFFAILKVLYICQTLMSAHPHQTHTTVTKVQEQPVPTAQDPSAACAVCPTLVLELCTCKRVYQQLFGSRPILFYLNLQKR